MKRPHTALALLITGLLTAMPCVGAAPPDVPVVLERPAVKTSRATQTAMLAIARAGNRLVSVGVAGIILLSDDSGKTWRQVDVPVSVSLTAVQFANATVGYATGHMGVVLKTTDGGEHWRCLMDGVRAAELVLEHAKAVRAKLAQDADTAQIETADRQLRDAQLLVSDGPDKPFLDLYFSDADNGFVFGAYNLILRTRDGGKSWLPWTDRVANPRGMHLYGMTAANRRLFLAGEQGLLLRADGDGMRFEPIDSPYDGSFFGIQAVAGVVVAYGLRGNAFRSTDNGQSWERIDAGQTASISSAAPTLSGGMLLVSQGGELVESTDPVGGFKRQQVRPPLPFTDVVEAGDGALVAATLAGVRRLPIDNQH